MPEQTTPPSEPVRNKHALLLAGQNILTDLLGTIAFVVIFAVTRSIPIAVGFGIASGLGLIGWMKLRRKPIDTMQWLSLFLVVVFGGTALLTRDPIFVKINPTLIYAAVGLIMLRPGWMNRYVHPLARASTQPMSTTASAMSGQRCSSVWVRRTWLSSISPVSRSGAGSSASYRRPPKSQ